MTNTDVQKLGFAPLVTVTDAPENGSGYLVDSYNYQNVYLAVNGDRLYLNCSIHSNQARLQTEASLTNINQVVGELTTDDLGKLEALTETFYATRGGRGQKLFEGFPY